MEIKSNVLLVMRKKDIIFLVQDAATQTLMSSQMEILVVSLALPFYLLVLFANTRSKLFHVQNVCNIYLTVWSVQTLPIA